MGLKLPEEDAKPGAPEWVTTFGDMMSLLLVFFVLLLSFSTMEMEKFKVVAGFMREAFGLQSELTYTGVPMGTTILSTDARSTTTTDDEVNLAKEVREAMKSAGLGGRGAVRVTERGVAIRMDGEVLFESGRAELKPEARALLDRIAEIAASQPGVVEVEGHTDDLPIRNERFPSNWELSSARAGAAARHLVSRGVSPDRIKAVGYADTRPVAPNTGPESRAGNRRVEFIFVRSTDGTGHAPPEPIPAGAE
jgi:chemotaxis protein MotB